MLGIYTVPQAIAVAEELGLDLVEINPKSDPPVCKIMDYGKYKYEKKKQERDAKRKRKEVEIKEIKLRPKTDDHDYTFKINHIKRFLSEGNKVKITVIFRGREVAHPETANEITHKLIEDLKELIIVEQPFKLEGKGLTTIIAPKGGVTA